MEDLSLLLEEYVNELVKIRMGKSDDYGCKRLMDLASSIKQFYSKSNSGTKGAITRECNAAKMYMRALGSFHCFESTATIIKYNGENLDKSIITATRRYMNHIIDM